MTERTDLHIGKRIRSRRRALGLTLTDLAAAADMRFQNLQKYELGIHQIPASVLFRLALALATEVDYFFEGLDASPKAVRAQ